MQVFLLTLGLLLIVFAAMAIGYILQKKTLAGSCGGLGVLGIEKACNCDNPCDRKTERLKKEERWKEDQIL